MKHIILLAMLTLFFSSCKPILTNSLGRFMVKKMHNGGTVSAKNYSVEVPFEIISGQIILKVYANKNSKDPLNFLFDSGSYSGVSAKIYEQFKGEFADLRTNRSDANRVTNETEVYLAKELYIGDILVEDFNLTIDEYVNKNLDGVIGADFMKDKVFTFDFPNNKLHISDVSTKKNENDYRFKLKRSWDKRYSSKINVAGTKMKVNFDTGTTGFLKTTNDFKLSGEKQVSYEVITRGTEEYYSKTFTYIQKQDLTFNKNKLDNAIVIKSADYSHNFLGTKILMENKVILDCNKKQMILQLKNEKIKMNVKEIPTHSFAIGWLEGLKIVQKKVEVNSIDLELYDEVIEINENNVPESQEELIVLLKDQKEVEIWNLIVKRGKKIIEVQVPQSILEF